MAKVKTKVTVLRGKPSKWAQKMLERIGPLGEEPAAGPGAAFGLTRERIVAELKKGATKGFERGATLRGATLRGVVVPPKGPASKRPRKKA